MIDRYYVYIVKLLNKDDRLTHYTGMTNNPQRRFKQHQGLIPGGARYCLSRRIIEMFIIYRFDSRSEALKAEKNLKRKNWHQKGRACVHALFSIKGGE